jgi:hypothetical protein
VTKAAPSDTLLERLVTQSADFVGSNQSSDDAARVLLADLLACVAASAAEQTSRPVGQRFDFSGDGTSGRVAALAIRAHSHDLDDIFWPAGTHIGSIVWPVVLALGAEVGAQGPRMLRAARMGYQVAGGTAFLLGRAHAAKWHATATAGTVGSAATAAVLLGLDAAMTVAACGHAATMAGGIGQSVAERSTTTAFHRSSAAVTGVLAARFARTGASAPAGVLEGPRGLLALVASDSPGLGESPTDVLAATSVRVFPVNGFSQGAVSLTAALRRGFDSSSDTRDSRTARPRSIVVEVAPAVAAATTGEVGGDWWDMRGAVAAAWTSADAFRLERTADSMALRNCVQVVGVTGDIGATRVIVNTSDGDARAELVAPPGNQPTSADSLRLLQRKWEELGAADPVELAERLLDDGVSAAEIEALLCEPATAQEKRM